MEQFLQLFDGNWLCLAIFGHLCLLMSCTCATLEVGVSKDGCTCQFSVSFRYLGRGLQRIILFAAST